MYLYGAGLCSPPLNEFCRVNSYLVSGEIDLSFSQFVTFAFEHRKRKEEVYIDMCHKLHQRFCTKH